MKTQKNLAKVSIRFSPEEVVEIERMLEKYNYHNVSKFIKKHLFEKEIKYIAHNKELKDVAVNLSEIIYQLRKIGVNYNQVVKQINRTYNTKTLANQIASLQKNTIELIQIAEEIIPILQLLKEKI